MLRKHKKLLRNTLIRAGCEAAPLRYALITQGFVSFCVCMVHISTPPCRVKTVTILRIWEHVAQDRRLQYTPAQTRMARGGDSGKALIIKVIGVTNVPSAGGEDPCRPRRSVVTPLAFQHGLAWLRLLQPQLTQRATKT